MTTRSSRKADKRRFKVKKAWACHITRTNKIISSYVIEICFKMEKKVVTDSLEEGEKKRVEEAVFLFLLKNWKGMNLIGKFQPSTMSLFLPCFYIILSHILKPCL